MGKLLFGFLFLILACLTFLVWQKDSKANQQRVSGDVVVSAEVDKYFTLTIDAGANVSFGNLNPGVAVAAPAGGTVVKVASNDPAGYALSINDNIPGVNSALLHTDGATRIADYAGTVANPTTWAGTGLGITLYNADTGKEAKWGTGVAFDDLNNKYAGIPQNPSVIHAVVGLYILPDTSRWAFKLNVGPTQKLGSYTGKAILIASTILA